MQAGLWALKYLIASGILFGILAITALGKGSADTKELLLSLAWAMFAAAIFVGSQYWRSRRELACSGAPCSGDAKRAVKAEN